MIKTIKLENTKVTDLSGEIGNKKIKSVRGEDGYLIPYRVKVRSYTNVVRQLILDKKHTETIKVEVED